MSVLKPPPPPPADLLAGGHDGSEAPERREVSLLQWWAFWSVHQLRGGGGGEQQEWAHVNRQLKRPDPSHAIMTESNKQSRERHGSSSTRSSRHKPINPTPLSRDRTQPRTRTRTRTMDLILSCLTVHIMCNTLFICAIIFHWCATQFYGSPFLKVIKKKKERKFQLYWDFFLSILSEKKFKFSMKSSGF